MRSGKLDRQVILQSFTLGTTGDPRAGTWTTEATVWAERMDARGIERETGMVVQAAEVTQAYRIRYRADVAVTPLWRINDGGELWSITAVLPGAGRNAERILLVSRLDPDDEA
jgi:head-tail adaptor